MGRYVIIPTRKEKKDCLELTSYFEGAGWKVHLIQNANSMLEAFAAGFEECSPKPEDLVIFCHDDIEILLRPEVFNAILEENLNMPNTGFVGVAGCASLGKRSEDANWFANVRGDGWEEHGGGIVFHGNETSTMKASFYGHRRHAVLLDGVFLAATGETINSISLYMPSVFKSKWHMYDALLSFQTYRHNLTNRIAPIMLRHESGGDYRREHYQEDSKMFMSLFARELPASVVD